MILQFRKLAGHKTMYGKAIEVSSEDEAINVLITNSPWIKSNRLKIISNHNNPEQKSIIEVGVVAWIFDTEEDFNRIRYCKSIDEFNNNY